MDSVRSVINGFELYRKTLQTQRSQSFWDPSSSASSATLRFINSLFLQRSDSSLHYQADGEGFDGSNATPLQAKDLRQSTGFIGPFSGPLPIELSQFTPDLMAVVNGWPHLNDRDKATIGEIVRTATTPSTK